MKQIPAQNDANPLKNYLAIRRDPLSFLTRVVQESGPFVRLRILTYPYLLINEPKLIREALVERHRSLIIEGGASSALARLIGHGILTNRGSAWRESRRSLQPLFQREALERSIPTMIRCIEDSFDRWRSGFGARPFAINRELLALSFRIKCVTLFHYDASFDEAEEFADAIWSLQRDGMDRYLSGLDLLPWMPLAINLRVDRSRAKLHALSRRIHRVATRYRADDILSLLFAGAESPANTLVWALKLLEENPSWIPAIGSADPVDPATPLSEVEAFDGVAQLLCETLRLYPAGWAFERYATEDVDLGGYLVPRGSRLLFSPYLLHRHPRYWREPERFDPTRFSKSYLSADGVPKFAYLPFGAGPRSCIGSRLAMLEMRLVLRMFLSRCAWSFDRKTEASPLRPQGSFKIRLNRPAMGRVRVSPS